MFLIIISHITPDFGSPELPSYVDTHMATSNFQFFLVGIYKYLGQLGVAIFIVCSAYFLCDRKNIRRGKVIEIVLDVNFISWIIFLVFILLGIKIQIKDIIKFLLPVVGGANWFVSCYVIEYFLHPYLNKISSNSTQKEYRELCLFLFMMYCIIQTVLTKRFFYNELVGFLCVYCFTAYYKAYLSKIQKNNPMNLVVFVTSDILLLILLSVWNLLGIRISILRNSLQYFRSFTNPLILFMAFALFGLFMNLKPKTNERINSVSTLTLYIYLLHENQLVRNYIRPEVFRYIYEKYTYSNIGIICMILSIFTLAVCIIVAYIYQKRIHRYVVVKLCDRIHEMCSSIGQFKPYNRRKER